MELLYVLLTAVLTMFVITFLTRVKQGMSALDVVGDETTIEAARRKREMTSGNPSERKAAGFNLEFKIEEI